jgi:hypothetical protein
VARATLDGAIGLKAPTLSLPNNEKGFDAVLAKLTEH